jgi:hypothetical protein
MITFKDFLSEEKTKQPNTAEDIEHLPLYKGHEGMHTAADMLDGLHNHFLGKHSDATMTMKYNGQPVAFGKKNKKFFVANDPAYPNYSHEDIEKNHSGDPATVGKLKTAFNHLSKIVPDDNGTYHGNMFTKSQTAKSKGQIGIVTPGQTYSVPSDSSHGKKLNNAHVSIAVDAKHNGTSFEPIDKKERAKFKDHPDVFHIDPSLPANPANYSHEDQQAYLNNRKQLEIAYGKSKPEMFDAMEGHGHKVAKHIDDMRKQGVPHSFDTYMDSLKGESNHTKLAERAIHNRKHFEDAMNVHALLQNGKNILAGVMHKNETFTHKVGGEPVEPEGALVHMHKGVSKGSAAILRRT